MRPIVSFLPQGDQSPSSSLLLPDGFEVLMQKSRPCRLQGRTPFLIYSNDSRFQRVFRYAIDSWNNAAQSIGIKPLFEAAVNAAGADTTLDWPAKRDVMYHGMHTNRYPSLSSVQLTQRDIQALRWLYNQQTFVIIVGI